MAYYTNSVDQGADIIRTSSSNEDMNPRHSYGSIIGNSIPSNPNPAAASSDTNVDIRHFFNTMNLSDSTQNGNLLPGDNMKGKMNETSGYTSLDFRGVAREKPLSKTFQPGGSRDNDPGYLDTFSLSDDSSYRRDPTFTPESSEPFNMVENVVNGGGYETYLSANSPFPGLDDKKKNSHQYDMSGPPGISRTSLTGSQSGYENKYWNQIQTQHSNQVSGIYPSQQVAQENDFRRQQQFKTQQQKQQEEESFLTLQHLSLLQRRRLGGQGPTNLTLGIGEEYDTFNSHYPKQQQQSSQQHRSNTSSYSSQQQRNVNANYQVYQGDAQQDWVISHGSQYRSASTTYQQHSGNYVSQQQQRQPREQQYQPGTKYHSSQGVQQQSYSGYDGYSTQSTGRPLANQYGSQSNQYQQYRSDGQANKVSPPSVINRDLDLENLIYQHTAEILLETATSSLKSVELANALRDRIGKDALASVKSQYGGLLVMLEMFPQAFQVLRVPKNDMVKLITNKTSPPALPSPISQNQQAWGGQQRRSYTAHQQQPMLQYQHLINPQQQHLPQSQHRQENMLPPPSPINSTFYGSNNYSNVLHITKIPNTATDDQIYNEFGGGYGIVERVSVEFANGKRSAFVTFSSVQAAVEIYNRMNTKYRGLLMFHQPSGQTPTASKRFLHHADSGDSNLSGLTTADPSPRSQASMWSNTQSQRSSILSNSSLRSSIMEGRGISLVSPRTYNAQTSDISDDFGDINSFNYEYDMNAGIAITNLNQESNTPSSDHDETETSSVNSNPLRLSNPNSQVSPPFEPRHVSGDDLSPHGSLPSAETTPRSVSNPNDVVLVRLCNVHYVPGKTWEVDTKLDMPYCEMIAEIVESLGGSIQMTKLKHQMKKRTKESIRIGPLKALISAYPQYFKVDASMSMVQSMFYAQTGQVPPPSIYASNIMMSSQFQEQQIIFS